MRRIYNELTNFGSIFTKIKCVDMSLSFVFSCWARCLNRLNTYSYTKFYRISRRIWSGTNLSGISLKFPIALCCAVTSFNQTQKNNLVEPEIHKLSIRMNNSISRSSRITAFIARDGSSNGTSKLTETNFGDPCNVYNFRVNLKPRGGSTVRTMQELQSMGPPHNKQYYRMKSNQRLGSQIYFHNPVQAYCYGIEGTV